MAENKHTLSDLYQMQALPLSAKIRMTEYRIRQWIEAYGEDGVYVSFSGGKDSTVLLDIVCNRLGYKDIPAVFVDVPTQYPELKTFAKEFCEKNEIELEILHPKMSFMEVCKKYGFPLISKEISQCVYEVQSAKKRGKDITQYAQYKRLVGKYSDKGFMDIKKYKFFLNDDAPMISHKCCNVMKKQPMHQYVKKTGKYSMMATMASESKLRTQKWLQNGCNAFNTKEPKSQPMAFWTEQDVLLYIKDNNLPIYSVYGDVVIDYDAEGNIDGQMDLSELASEFGVFDTGNRPLRTTGCSRTGCVLCGFGCHLEKPDEARFVRLKETHPGLYGLLDVIENNGVTYRQAIDWVNEHGNLNIRY